MGHPWTVATQSKQESPLGSLLRVMGVDNLTLQNSFTTNNKVEALTYLPDSLPLSLPDMICDKSELNPYSSDWIHSDSFSHLFFQDKEVHEKPFCVLGVNLDALMSSEDETETDLKCEDYNKPEVIPCQVT